ncbi:oxidoreductase [Oceanicola sp. 22II-s10i]|uniref:NAD(P)/FAD-dependent oxidoreductase n=1 Tax=Oceanicola sp. 22II-s10i TaxID=1317116 RepID=UPI000B524724|nr:FAD-binding oxidoreductase [Oceanicola sp. 22II-s10i]OWU85807.1 oxidoreductase [Oceanicola sp. 22II-s10i]
MKNLWTDSSAERFDAPAFSGQAAADLCVIGGGFTGCSAALAAAEQGAKVVLLEGATVGHGGSGRNVGLVNAGLWTPPDKIEAILPGGTGERLVTMLGEAPALVFDLIERHGIACEPRRAGTLHLAHAASGLADLRERHRQQSGRGAPVTLLDAAETARRTGSDRFHGALHDTRAGTVQPLAYCRGLARAAVSAGAALHENSPVTGLRREGDSWIVRTANGHVVANSVVLASNAYHTGLADTVPGPMTPVHYFQAATDPLPEGAADHILPGGEGCWDTAMVMTSVRRDAAGRIIIGAMGSLEAPGRALHLGWARRRFRRYFPDLPDPVFTHAWSGRIGMSSDKLPRILYFGPSAYAAFGYSGRGIAPGTLFGKAMATAALSGDETGLPLVPVDTHAEGFTKLRGAWFETGAALIHGLGDRV